MSRSPSSSAASLRSLRKAVLMMQQVPRMDSVTPFSACTTPRCRKLRRRARINVLLLFLATTVVLGFMAMVFLLNGGTQFISYATPVFVRMALLLSPQALTASLLP